jgi:hypothetical protein
LMGVKWQGPVPRLRKRLRMLLPVLALLLEEPQRA